MTTTQTIEKGKEEPVKTSPVSQPARGNNVRTVMPPPGSTQEMEPQPPPASMTRADCEREELSERKDIARLFVAGCVVLLVIACLAFCVKILLHLYF